MTVHRLPARIPAVSAVAVERPRLDGSLHRLSAGEVRCVCLWASAGAGKTTLLADWARRLRRAGESVTWWSGQELGSFWPGDVWRQAGQGAPVAEMPGDGETRYVFIDELDRAEAHRPGLVVELVESAPAGIRLVVAGRTWTGAGLTRLRAAGSMIDVPPADLAFDRSELLALAARHSVILTHDETVILLERTAGWVTGLVLVLSLLYGADDAARLVRDFDGDHLAVADFLRSEVIAGWGDGDENTMLLAAVRAVVSVDLAVAVTKRADAGAVLDRLARRNDLITREHVDDGGGYRIHPILLAYLQAEARRRNAVAAAAAHEIAARWFTRRAEGHNALEQSLAARLPALVAETLEAFGVDLVLRGKPDLVLKVLARSPALAGNSGSAVVATLRLLLDAPYFPDRERTRHLLTNLGAAGQPIGEHAQTWKIVIDALTAFLAVTHDEMRDCLAGLSATRNAPGRGRDLGAALLAATAEAWCHAGLGEAVRAEAGMREVAVSARNAGFEWLFLLAGDLAATSAARRGDWMRASVLDEQVARATGTRTSVLGEPLDRAAARAWISRQVRQHERCDPLDTSTLERIVSADPLVADPGLIVPAQVLLALSSLVADPKSRSVLESLNALMQENALALPRLLSLCCIPWFDLAGALGGRAEARRVAHLVEVVLGENSLESVLLRFLAYPAARSRHGADGRLEAAATQAAQCWRGSTLVTAWLVLAGIAVENDRPVQADARVVQALRLAAQLRVERAFLAAGGLGVSLLGARIGRWGDLEDFASRILTVAGPGEGETRTVPAAPLTKRERELLRELPFHQSVTDIARKHNVSPNTVKTHLRSIYRKLEATDRARAVIIAHERGLL